MMGETADVINQYTLLGPFQNKNAGFCRWTFAKKREREYFLKEFLNPVYPVSDAISEDRQRQMVEECEEFAEKRKAFYEVVNRASAGNIVRILEFFRCDSHYYISTERIQAQKIHIQSMPMLPLETRILLCKTIAYEMMRLHSEHIVHADIKEDNILIKRTRGGNFVGKIIDFDSGFFEDDPPASEEALEGDQVYLSPEACLFMCGESANLSCKMDVFALGLLFHQYLTGNLPGFDQNEYDYAFEAVLDDQKLEISQDLPAQLKKMLNGMLQANPEERFSMKNVYSIFVEMDSKSGHKTQESERGPWMQPGDL